MPRYATSPPFGRVITGSEARITQANSNGDEGLLVEEGRIQPGFKDGMSELGMEKFRSEA